MESRINRIVCCLVFALLVFNVKRGKGNELVMVEIEKWRDEMDEVQQKRGGKGERIG